MWLDLTLGSHLPLPIHIHRAKPQSQSNSSSAQATGMTPPPGWGNGVQAPRVPPHEQYMAKGDSRRVWQSASARTGPTLDALELEEGAVVGLRDDGSLIRAAASVSGTPGHAVRPTPNCASMRHVRRWIPERETKTAEFCGGGL
jgi:hypothetical protein